MARELEVFFDFMSPPTYLAWTQIPDVLERTGAYATWRPMLTLGLLKLTGNRSPREVPNKAAWMGRDLQLYARRYGVTLNSNPHMESLQIVPALRGALVAGPRGEAGAYLKAMFEGMWIEGANIGEPATFRRLLGGAGLDAEAYLAEIEAEPVKAALRANTEEAAVRGAFGAPSFFVGGELFWGQDRLDFVEAALAALPG